MSFWLSDISKHAPEKVVKILVGNKSDKVEETDDMQMFGEDREVGYD